MGEREREREQKGRGRGRGRGEREGDGRERDREGERGLTCNAFLSSVEHTPSSQPPDAENRPIRVERSSNAPGNTRCMLTFDPRFGCELSADAAILRAAVFPVAALPASTTISM